MGTEVRVSYVDDVTPRVFWENKDLLFENRERNSALWQALSPEEQAKAIEGMRFALTSLLDSVEEWIEEGFRPNSMVCFVVVPGEEPDNAQ